MANVTQEITFESGALNWDDSRLFTAKGDSRYRLNVFNAQFGSEYVITNLKGNTKYTHSFTHHTDYAGSIYSCIGTCYDDNRDATYLFIHSSGGNHSILRFNFASDADRFEKIAFDHTGLGLDKDYPITDAFMIGDRLHWNPRSSSPRSINVQWAYYDHVAYYAYGGIPRSTGDFVRLQNKIYVALVDTAEGYPPLVPDEYKFVDYCYADTFPVNATDLDATVTSGAYFRYRDFYNVPPFLDTKPNVAVDTDTSYQYNNVRGRIFQFCYRQYVKDQGYTISSPYTEIIAAPASEDSYGEVAGDIDAFNLLNVDFLVQSALPAGGIWYRHYMLYEFVEVLFREGPDDNWKIAERVNYETISANILATGDDTYTVAFYNDRSYEVADNASVEKQYNALPITSRSQWSLDGNRVAYGGNVEGFDAKVDINVALTVGENELTRDGGDILGAGPQDTISFTETVSSTGYRTLTSDDILINPGGGAAVVGDVITVTVNGIDRQSSLVAPMTTDFEYAERVLSVVMQ
jgi:hypothetical protein